MALSLAVTNTGVSKRHPKLWDITMQLVVSDDAEPVLTQSFTRPYKQGQPIADLYARFLADMQESIDDYKGEQTYANHAQMASLVSALNDNLTV